MAGVGTELKKLIPKVFSSTGCKCNDYAAMMDTWGIKSCERRKHIIIADLVKRAQKKRLLKHLPKAALHKQAEVWVTKAINRAKLNDKK